MSSQLNKELNFEKYLIFLLQILQQHEYFNCLQNKSNKGCEFGTQSANSTYPFFWSLNFLALLDLCKSTVHFDVPKNT